VVTDLAATVNSGGTEIVSAGVLSGVTLSTGGVVVVRSGGLAVIDSGSTLSGATVVSSGGTIEFVGINAHNEPLQLLSGATGELGAGAFLSGVQISRGLTLVILSGGTAFGGTISAGGVAILEPGGAVTSDGNHNPLFVN
jgi:autotransporter passenger strand-loop-strand repeat protein